MQSYGKKISWDQWKQSVCLQVNHYQRIIKNWWFVKLSSENIKIYLIPLALPFFCYGKMLKVCSNFWEFWFFQEGGTFLSKLLTFKALLAFVILTSLKLLSLGPAFFSIVQTSCQHLCSGFPKIPYVGPHPIPCDGPRLRHSIGRRISLISTNQHGVEQSLTTTKCGSKFAFWCVKFETLINGIYTSSNHDKLCSYNHGQKQLKLMANLDTYGPLDLEQSSNSFYNNNTLQLLHSVSANILEHSWSLYLYSITP